MCKHINFNNEIRYDFEDSSSDIDDQDVDTMIEEFERILVQSLSDSNKSKRKMKPNISSEWIKKLRSRLNKSVNSDDKNLKQGTEKTMATI